MMKCQESKRVDVRAVIQLKACRDRLTKQQYKTLKGQILSGNGDGAMKGLRNILSRQQKMEVKH